MAFLFVVSCVTVNVYFPAAAVQKAADEIVEDVRTEGQKPAGQQGSGLRFGISTARFSLGPSEAWAADVNIDVSTPAIRNLKESMARRFPQLKPFYDKGAVGENRSGLLDLRDVGGLNLKEKAQLNKLVEQENNDRMSLYRNIVEANKFGPEMISQVQRIFANSWRDKSQPGWWIQNDKGEWERKK